MIKNKENSHIINELLRCMKSLQSDLPRILVIKDLIRISNKDEKTVILNDFHLLPTSGHAGVNRMLNNIKKYYFWPGISNDVIEYVQKCKECQIKKHSNKQTKQPMSVTTTPNTGFERVSLDIVGPLDVDNYNYKYILTLQCHLTKFVEAYPLTNKDSESISRTFVNKFILRYGIPKEIITDQGTEFLSSVMSDVCSLLGITKLHSTAYHHQTIGGLENTHKSLGAYLRIQCSQNKTDWSSWLSYWCFSFNTTVHSETKYTPHELVFGKLCNLPSNLNYTLDRVDPLYNFDSYPLELKYRLQRALLDARNNLIISKLKRKSLYDKKLNSITYKPGDFVLLKNQTGHKLDNIYLGPYKVLKDLSPNVEILKNNKSYIVHKDNTKLFCEP